MGGGTPHIPIKGIWSDIQARVGTPHIPIEGIWSDIQARMGTFFFNRTKLMIDKQGRHRSLQLREKISKSKERGGDTAHIIYNEMKDRRVMNGWLDGWMVLCNYNATSWLHLASWNLPDSQLN